MAKIDAYTLADGITRRFRARPSGTNPATGKGWPNRTFDTWAAADRYQRHPVGGGDAEPPLSFTDDAVLAAAGVPVAVASRPSLTLSEYVDIWLERHNGAGQPTSQRGRRSHLRAVKDSALGSLSLPDITPADVRAYVNGVTATGLSASSAEGRLAVIRAVLDTAVEEQRLRSNPARARGVKAPRSSKAPRARTMTREQFDTIAMSLPTWLYPAAILAAYCGLRIGEVCGLRWEAVNLDAGKIRVRDVVLLNGIERDYPKGVDIVTIPLPEPVVAMLRAHREAFPGRGSDHVFREPGKGRTLVTTDRVRVLWRKARKAAWLDDGAQPPRFHDLRHLFANDLIDRGVSPVRVQRLMRHQNLNTTQRYFADPEFDDLARAMNSAPIAS